MEEKFRRVFGLSDFRAIFFTLLAISLDIKDCITNKTNWGLYFISLGLLFIHLVILWHVIIAGFFLLLEESLKNVSDLFKVERVVEEQTPKSIEEGDKQEEAREETYEENKLVKKKGVFVRARSLDWPALFILQTILTNQAWIIYNRDPQTYGFIFFSTLYYSFPGVFLLGLTEKVFFNIAFRKNGGEYRRI